MLNFWSLLRHWIVVAQVEGMILLYIHFHLQNSFRISALVLRIAPLLFLSYPVWFPHRRHFLSPPLSFDYIFFISGDDNISSLELLSEFTHLKKLYLLDLPGIEGLNPLHTLINLDELSIHHSPNVVNIDALLDMNYLRDVSLFDTRVSHIDALVSKPYLRRLDLYNNPVQDLTTVLNLNSLTYFQKNDPRFRKKSPAGPFK